MRISDWSSDVCSSDLLAERVAKQEAQVQNVTIYGFADRIGSAGGNYDLSLARAHTVADLLVAKGVDSKLIEVVAKGRFESTTECKSGTSKAALIDCLQPDRPVLVTVRHRTAAAAATCRRRGGAGYPCRLTRAPNARR